jgi:transposase
MRSEQFLLSPLFPFQKREKWSARPFQCKSLLYQKGLLRTVYKTARAERARILFWEFPEIKEAHDIICSFRNFYKCKIGKGHRARESLDKWYKKTKIEEIKNFRHTVKRHEGEIMNYFEEGHTNAFAESLNNKIQSFVRSNYGVRDRDFFHFRLMKFLS